MSLCVESVFEGKLQEIQNFTQLARASDMTEVSQRIVRKRLTRIEQIRFTECSL